MQAAPTPANEAARLAALVRYAILDTPAEAAFDRLTRLAAQLFDVPMALISLVDAERQWFKSHYGLAVSETSRDVSFCAHAILNDRPLVVPDAMQDPRFRDNPLVTGAPGLRFYAGAPLRTSDELHLGTFCLLSPEPRRPLSEQQVQILEEFAALAVEELERRMAAEKLLALEAALHASEERFRTFLDHAPAVAFVKDHQGRLRYVNQVFLSTFGGTSEDYLGKDTFALWPGDAAQAFHTGDQALLVSQKPVSALETFRTPDGKLRCWLMEKFAFSDLSGEPLIGGIGVDLTEREHLRAALQASEERWKLALEGANDGLWDWDLARQSVFYSDRWKEMLGYTPAELPDCLETWRRLLHPDDLDPVQQKFQAYLSKRAGRYETEFRLRAKDGSWRWILARGQAVWDSNGQATRIVGSHTDITERKRMEQQLAEEASTDPLTGVANRRRIMRELQTAVQNAGRYGDPFSVVVCDLNDFKQINDTFGHDVGDEVLIGLAQTLQTSVRDRDLVGRLGGDEFCLVLHRATAAQCALCVERIRQRLATLRFGERNGSHGFAIGAAFGVAEWKPEDDIPQLLSAADRALYAEKGQRRHSEPVLPGQVGPEFAGYSITVKGSDIAPAPV